MALSEYSKRILAFSAIAIILGIGISAGIALFPFEAGTQSSATQRVSTMTSTATVVQSVTSVVTSIASSTGQIESSTTGPVSTGTTTFASTITGASTTTGTGVSTSISSLSSTTVASSTSGAPCGSPGAYCGSASITSVNLTVGNGSSTLQITLAEIGNMYIGSATVYVNGTVIGTPPASQYQPPGNIILNIQADQPAVLVLVIPTSTIAIHVGAIYSVLVYAWLGPPGQRANSGLPAPANVTAV